MKIHTAWAMPNKWTFQIKPIGEFVYRWLDNRDVIVDPFCGSSKVATHSNDIVVSGIKSQDWCESLLCEMGEEWADAVIFDPPYSPRQISECYKSINLKATGKDTQNAALYASVRRSLARILRPGGVALSFGWQSSGFGKSFETLEILLVQHGGAHNDTICVAQTKPVSLLSDGRD